MTLRPGADEQANFTYRERAAGTLEVRLNVKDAFPQDDRVVVELPPLVSSRVVIYSREPQSLRPLFAFNPQVEAVFEPPEKFDPNIKDGVVVLDRFTPPVAPRTSAIWIEPSVSGSPIPVRSKLNQVSLDKWHPETPLGAGLRTKDVTLESAETFVASSGDIVVAEAGGSPVVVARAGNPKQVVIGFLPSRPSMKYELATPLLIANILRWVMPGDYRRWEVQAGTVGTVTVPIEANTDPSEVHVLDESNRPLPFTLDADSLRFFSGAPGTVRVQTGDREMAYSLTLPDVAEVLWHAPAGVRTGIPRAAPSEAAATDLWPWLALLGGLGLLADWLLFGRSRAFRLRAARMAAPLMQWRKAS
ncbi:MAG: hypothetical protein ACRD5L_00830, partial [Bryobacteraceae bacterium]